MPAETPVEKIRIREPEELLRSAQRGCLTCLMVATSLSRVPPGWEKGKTILTLFLAPNLPLVVRMQFGTASSLTVGPEAILELGVVLPEGWTMNWEAEVESHDSQSKNEKVEVEIYRNDTALEQATVGGTS